MVETYVRKFPRYSRKFSRYSHKLPRYLCFVFLFLQEICCKPVFNCCESLAQAYHPIFLGLPFSYLQPRLPFSYYVMERAAKACEEPENTWNDQKLRYFKFSSLSHPGSSKSRFCWISLFFLALRAPQVWLHSDLLTIQLRFRSNCLFILLWTIILNIPLLNIDKYWHRPITKKT